MTSRFIRALVLCLLASTFTATAAFAGVYRGGTISWSPTATSGEIEFRFNIAQKRDGERVGDSYSAAISFGDGVSSTVVGKITSVNTAEEWFIASMTVKHTYATDGTFTAAVDVCCRLDSLGNGADKSLRLETLVSPLSGNSSPVSGLPAIVTVPLSAAAKFTVPAADINRDTLKFRFATEVESGAPQPAGLSLNETTGEITWDAVSAGADATTANLWTTQLVVEDRDSLGILKSRIPVDVIIKVVAASGAAPSIALNPSAATVQVAPGSPVTFDVTASDTDTTPYVTLNSSSLPSGATLTPALDAVLAAPVTSTFAWTPTTAQAGAYVLTFAATDDAFQQTLKSLVIYVGANTPPVFGSCPATVSVQPQDASGAQVTLENTVSDADADAIQLTWKVDGTTAKTQSLPAGSTAPTAIELVKTYALGSHTVVLSATGGASGTTTCTTTVSVAAGNQSITFANPGPFTYGHAPVTLGATATSNLPVAFAVVSGPGTIADGVLTITGAGSIVVRATQAGDSTWLAAPAADQTIVVAKAPLTVKANDATKVYGAALPTFGVTYQGFVLGEGPSALSGTLAFSTPVTGSTAVGTYAVRPNGVTSANYLVTFQAGTFTVTKATLTVTAANASITVGSPLPAFSAAITGYVLGEDQLALGGTLAFSVPAGAASAPGTYAITPSGLTAANYQIVYVNGVLSVSAAVVCGYEGVQDANADRTIPIKLSLCTTSGQNLTSSSLRLTAYELVGPGGATAVPQDSGNSNPGGVFRLAGHQYIFNLKTKGLSSGTWELHFHVGADSAPYSVSFTIR